MPRTLTLTTPASVAPVTVDEAASTLRLTSEAEKTTLTELLTVAIEQIKAETERELTNATYTLTLDAFPAGRLKLPKAPLASVTSITYKDTAGDSQTWDSAKYVVRKPASPTAGPGWVEPAYCETYPDTYAEAGAVTVTYVVGYGATAATVPVGLKLACSLRAGELYHGTADPNLETVLTPFKGAGIA